MKKESYQVLSIPEFRNYLLSRFFGIIAIHIQSTIIGWQIYEITKDPLSLGLIGLAEIIPALSVSLYAGHIADILDRRKIILACMTLLTICSFLLIVISQYFTVFFQSNIYYFYGVIFLSGIARGFITPSQSALVAMLVKKELYPISAAWNSTVWQVAAVFGPALGGMLYGFSDELAGFSHELSGAVISYSVDFLFMCIALFFIYLLSPQKVTQVKPRENFFKSLSTGIKFVYSKQELVAAMSLDLFAVLFGGATALLPIFAAEILKVGPEGLGILRAAPSIGAALMAVYLAHNPPLKNSGKILLYNVAGYGFCMLFFGLSTDFYLSLFLLGLSGAFDNVSVVIRSTIMQLMTPDDMRGRVAAVNGMFIGSSNELGAFESGATAKAMGAVRSVVFGGVATIGVVVYTWWKADKLKKMEFEKFS